MRRVSSSLSRTFSSKILSSSSSIWTSKAFLFPPVDLINLSFFSTPSFLLNYAAILYIIINFSFINLLLDLILKLPVMFLNLYILILQHQIFIFLILIKPLHSHRRWHFLSLFAFQAVTMVFWIVFRQKYSYLYCHRTSLWLYGSLKTRHHWL